MTLRVSENYWSRAAEIALEVYRSGQFASLDEQAGPAYLKGNLLSRWVFWQRLKHVLRLLPSERGALGIDFGCGFGLLLPALATRYSKVVGIDVVPELPRAYLKRWEARHGGSTENVSIRSSLDDSGLCEGTVDLIMALDVLEHCEDVHVVLQAMSGMLRPGGLLVVTGPTENLIYRIGRKIVGFSGDYHHHDVYYVIAAMKERFSVHVLRRLPRVAPLFVIAVGSHNGQ